MPNANFDDSMMTPYGPPSPYAYIIPGKGRKFIWTDADESGAKI